jgi:hypothetical protein
LYTGDGYVLFRCRRADVRFAVLLSSTGMALPSAVEGARDVDERLAGPEYSVGKENESGRRLVYDPVPACGGFGGRAGLGADATDEAGGGRIGVVWIEG